VQPGQMKAMGNDLRIISEMQEEIRRIEGEVRELDRQKKDAKRRIQGYRRELRAIEKTEMTGTSAGGQE